jgi:urease accessory protein
VGTAAFPVGDDEVCVEAHVEEGASLVVRSAASAVAWAGTGSSLEVDITVDPGGRLDWQLQPLIASARCRFSQRSRVRLGNGATLRWAEEVVLGRSGEDPGWLDLRLDVTVDGMPLLRHQLELGRGVPGWDGPAVVGANRAVGFVLLAGDALPAAVRRGARGSAAWPPEVGPPETGRLGTGRLGTGPLGTGRLGTGPLGTGRLGTGAWRHHHPAGAGWAVMPLEGPGLIVSAVAADILSLRAASREATQAVGSSGEWNAEP